MPKPVTILTGFLGAGKTTFLNAVLAHKPQSRFAIIENEFGEEGIDGELLVSADDELIEMNNGCLCCTLNDNLYDILTNLHQRSDEFDELLIESTGIADPAGIALPFLTHPAIKQNFPLTRVICLVDVERIEEQLQNTEEAVKQIAFSDILLLNKTDKVSEADIHKLEQVLHQINPFAMIFSGSKESYPIEAAFSFSRDTEAVELTENSPEAAYTHHHSHTHQHGSIVSLSFRFSTAFDMQALSHRLFQLLRLQAKDVYRVKGVLNVAGENNRIILQSVGSNLEIEKGKAWEEHEVRVSRIVIIGRNLKETGFERMLKQCLTKGT